MRAEKDAMTRRTAIAGAVTLLALLIEPAGASFYDGNMLLAKCTGSFRDKDICASYIMGVADDVKDNNDELCLPDGVTGGQLSEIVTAYLQRKVATRHRSAASLVGLALLEAFKC